MLNPFLIHMLDCFLCRVMWWFKVIVIIPRLPSPLLSRLSNLFSMVQVTCTAHLTNANNMMNGCAGWQQRLHCGHGVREKCACMTTSCYTYAILKARPLARAVSSDMHACRSALGLLVAASALSVSFGDVFAGRYLIVVYTSSFHDVVLPQQLHHQTVSGCSTQTTLDRQELACM